MFIHVCVWLTCLSIMVETSSDLIPALTEATIDNALARNSLMLINFHAPWCAHCKNVASKLESAATLLDEGGVEVRIATVDVEAAPTLAERYEITGYPTLGLFRNGHYISQYVGERSALDIVRYLTRKTAPVAIYVNSVSDIEEQVALSRDELYLGQDLMTVALAIFPLDSSTSAPAATAAAPSSSGEAESVVEYDSNQRKLAHFARELRLLETQRSRYRESHKSGDKQSGSKTGAGAGSVTGIFSPIARKYLEAASKYELTRFLITDSEELVRHYQAISDQLVILSSSADDVVGCTSLTRSHSTADFKRIVLTHSVPLVLRFGSEMRPLVDLLPVQRHVLVFTAGDTVTAMRKTATSMGQRQTGILEGVERNGLKDGASPHTSGAKPSAVDASEVLIKEVYRVSPWYRSRLLFLVVPETEHTVLHFFGVRLVDLPQVVVVDMSDPDDPRRYAMQASHVKGVFGGGYIDSDELPPEKPGTTPPPRPPLPSPPPEKLAGFLDDLLGGKLSPSLKSQSPISPASASASAPGTGKTAGAGTSDSSSSSRSSGSRACSSDELSSRVVRLTAREFQARVVEMAGDVLLMFHSPWCGHCKSMQAILADTADFYTSHLPDAPLVFARMDAIKNEIRAPGVHINGYPTIYLFLSSNKSQPVEYLGARNVPAIVRFLAKHTPHIVNPVDDVDESKNVAVDTQ